MRSLEHQHRTIMEDTAASLMVWIEFLGGGLKYHFKGPYKWWSSDFLNMFKEKI